MRSPTLRVLLALLWIFLLLIGYYWGHKPVSPAAAASLGSGLVDIVLVALTLCLSGAVGRMVLIASGLPGLENPVIQAAAGQGLVAMLWLLLGVAGLYTPAAAWIVLAGGLAALNHHAYAWFKDVIAELRRWWGRGWFESVLVGSLIFLASLQVLIALAPPLKYDALTYHLELPHRYIQAGRLVFTPENPYWGHPQLGEMLFTWMGLLHRPQTAAVLSTAWGWLALLGVAATTRRLVDRVFSISSDDAILHPALGRTAGLVAAAALMTGATFRWLGGWAYTDLLSVWMGWSALALAFQLMHDPAQGSPGRTSRLLWVGVLCGFAIGAKWTGALLPAGLFSGLLLQRRLPLRTWLAAVALTLVVAAPWLIKNWLATGSPLYPYFFPTEWISAQQQTAASAGEVGLPLWRALAFPITATLLGWDSAVGYGADLGPLLTALALPGLLYGRRDRGVQAALLWPLALVWLAVLVGSRIFNHLQQPRLYFAVLPAVGMAAGLGWAGLSRLRLPALRLERLLAALLLLVLALCLVQDVTRTAALAPTRPLLGAESDQTYLERNLGMYALAMQALDALPPGSQTLMLWEARGLYAPTGATTDPWIDRWRADYWRYGSVEDVLSAWRAAGFTYLLVYQSGMQAVRAEGGALEPAGWAALDELLAALQAVNRLGEVYVLYALPE